MAANEGFILISIFMTVHRKLTATEFACYEVIARRDKETLINCMQI